MREKIMRLPKWAVVLIALISVAGFFAVMNVSSLLLALLPPLPGYGASFIGELLVSIYAVLILALLGYSGVIKETGVGFLRSFYIGGFMVGYCFFAFVAQLYVLQMNGEIEIQPFLSIVFFIATMLLIGFAEEFIFRGVVLNMVVDRFSKTKRGILGAILIESLIFGGVHLMNFFSGVSLVSACVQAFVAALLGVILSAVYARSRNIWIVVLTHAMTDFAALMGTGIFGSGGVVEGINNISYTNLLAVPVLLIPCLVLLRKSKLEEMVRRANGEYVTDAFEEADKIATVSLILGILGIVSGFMGYGMGLGVVGILGSCVSKKIKPYENGVATAGLITSIIGTVIAVFMTFVFSLTFALMGPQLMEMPF